MKLTHLTEHIWITDHEQRRDRPKLGYIHTNERTIAIDAGHSKEHVQEFYDLLAQENLPLPELTLITHWHWDHTFGMHAVHGLTCVEKNTEQELDSQDGELVKALLHELTNRDLIVFGYSGRDQSLMQALTQVYSERGAGKLFWCGYGQDAPAQVAALINHANNHGRTAFYIPTSGFDSAMYSITRHCMSGDKSFVSKVDELKRKLAVAVEPKSVGFLLPEEPVNKVAGTNAYPIAFPSQCYQFEVSYEPKEKPWEFCRQLCKQDIMAVPHKGVIYAWGAKETIEDICSSRIKGSIELCPLPRNFVANNGTMQELLLLSWLHLLKT